MAHVFRHVFTVLALVLLSVRLASAQEVAFIQIEAQPSLARAEDRARDYSSYLPNVNGFSIGGGWYGIALGPYEPAAAEALLRELRRSGQVPRDSYLVTRGELRQQFWPIGAALDQNPQPVEPVTDTGSVETALPATEPEPEPEIKPSDETPREARASEAALTRDERKDLQEMLAWAGVYSAAIDGAFGRGTRGAMAEWQRLNSYEPTGVLTTAQRADLKAQYDAILDGLDLREVTEARAGIRMLLPMGVVSFDKYESPFVHFTPSSDLDARVYLISQPGDQNTLFGLYDIMQTLEIVPIEGERERRSRSFTLTGANNRIVSYTEAGLIDGAVKGFTLIWPAGDEERRRRVLSEMRASFRAVEGVLDPSAISEDGQGVDLVSGLEVRKPKLNRSGFYVDGTGTVVTTSDVAGQCTRITLDDAYEVEVAASNDTLGIAVLKPKSALAPMEIAAFRSDTPRLKSDVAVAGFSFGGALGSPTLTFGTLSDLAGLSGEPQLKRLALSALPGDAGGPVLDTGGAVLGMLLPRETGARQLPNDVSFAVKASEIRALLAEAGLSPRATEGESRMDPVDLTNIASDMTVLVSCWD